jgi:predicted RNA-binding protein with PIN domain
MGAGIIIDGYNVIHQITALKQAADQRLALVRMVHAWKEHRQYRGTVTIVYDGSGQSGRPNDEGLPGVKCVFTRTGETADGRIVEMVRKNSRPQEMTVVSDDNYVGSNCRNLGARVEPVGYLQRPGRIKSAGDDKKIGRNAEREINEKLKKAWGME